MTLTLPARALPPAESLRRGARDALPYAVATLLVGVSFGVYARDGGMSTVAATTMSALVFGSSAQFAAVAAISAGSPMVVAVLAGALMHSRYLPMGIALAPSLAGSWWWRGAQGQTVVDPSWALAARGDGTFDRWRLFGASIPQYATWVGGTLAGCLAGGVIGDTKTFGLDALFPGFFVVLVVIEIRQRGRRAALAAALGAGIVLATTPLLPAGAPVLLASLGALVGLHASDLPRRRRTAGG